MMPPHLFFTLLIFFFHFSSSGLPLVLTLVKSLCFQAPETLRELLLDMKNGSGSGNMFAVK